MKIKVSEASGPVLDWMTTKAKGYGAFVLEPNGFLEAHHHGHNNYSTDPTQGFAIIEREAIDVVAYGAATSTPKNPDYWEASVAMPDEIVVQTGPTPLIAAMRAYVCSKLGEEVEVPERLL